MDDNSQILDECPPRPKRPRRSMYSEIKINQDDAYDSDVMSDSNYDPLQDNDQNSENEEHVQRSSGNSSTQKSIRKALLSGNSMDTINPDTDDQSKRSNFVVWNHDGLASFVSLICKSMFKLLNYVCNILGSRCRSFQHTQRTVRSRVL